MRKCNGITFFVRRTMLGDEVRRCEKCKQEYVFVPTPLPPGGQGKHSLQLYVCGDIARDKPS